MRTELAYQWDMLEEEIPTLFEELLQSVKDQLLELKSTMRGKFDRDLPHVVKIVQMLIEPYALDKGFTSTLVNGIDFRIQDIEYKFGLIRRGFEREVKYGCHSP